MRRPIRILMIEDSEDDQELMLRQIRKGGYQPEYLNLHTKKDLLDALDKYQWDLVLCDFNLPAFDGLSAHQIVKQKSPNTPFLLVSDTIPEIITDLRIQSVAPDYLQKDNLTALVPVIEKILLDRKNDGCNDNIRQKVSNSEKNRLNIVKQITENIQRKKMEKKRRFCANVAC